MPDGEEGSQREKADQSDGYNLSEGTTKTVPLPGQ
jgi:hypothetical protein